MTLHTLKMPWFPAWCVALKSSICQWFRGTLRDQEFYRGKMPWPRIFFWFWGGKEWGKMITSHLCGTRNYLEGIVSWLRWLLGNLPQKKHEMLSYTHRIWLVNTWSKILSTYMAKAPLWGFLLPLLSTYHLHLCLLQANTLWGDKSLHQKEGQLFQVWLPPGTNWDHFQCCRGQCGFYIAVQDLWG